MSAAPRRRLRGKSPDPQRCLDAGPPPLKEVLLQPRRRLRCKSPGRESSELAVNCGTSPVLALEERKRICCRSPDTERYTPGAKAISPDVRVIGTQHKASLLLHSPQPRRRRLSEKSPDPQRGAADPMRMSTRSRSRRGTDTSRRSLGSRLLCTEDWQALCRRSDRMIKERISVAPGGSRSSGSVVVLIDEETSQSKASSEQRTRSATQRNVLEAAVDAREAATTAVDVREAALAASNCLITGNSSAASSCTTRNELSQAPSPRLVDNTNGETRRLTAVLGPEKTAARSSNATPTEKSLEVEDVTRVHTHSIKDAAALVVVDDVDEDETKNDTVGDSSGFWKKAAAIFQKRVNLLVHKSPALAPSAPSSGQQKTDCLLRHNHSGEVQTIPYVSTSATAKIDSLVSALADCKPATLRAIKRATVEPARLGDILRECLMGGQQDRRVELWCKLTEQEREFLSRAHSLARNARNAFFLELIGEGE